MSHISRAPTLESYQTHNPFRMTIVAKPIVAIAGMVAVPDGPGLGINVDPDRFADYQSGL